MSCIWPIIGRIPANRWPITGQLVDGIGSNTIFQITLLGSNPPASTIKNILEFNFLRLCWVWIQCPKIIKPSHIHFRVMI